MTEQEIKAIIEKQRAYFDTGSTIPVKNRIAALKKLHAVIKANEKAITDALTSDLGKSAFEGFMCEAGIVMSEISYMIKHTRKFAADSSRVTCLTNFAAKSFVKPSPEKPVTAATTTRSSTTSTVLSALTITGCLPLHLGSATIPTSLMEMF